MPPACTRNRAILYGVPWLAVALTVGLTLISPAARANSLGVWGLAGSIFIVGLPHGATDWWVMRVVAGSYPHPAKALVFLAAAYMLAALVTFAFWHWQPGWALAGFMALTAWHFGSAEASVLLPDRTPLHDPVWWLFGVGRGLLVVFASLAFRPAQAALVLLPFASLGADTGDVIHGLLRTAPTLLWLGTGLQTLGLCLEIRLRATRANQRTLALESLETGVLFLLFQIAPPLLAFVCYWVGFHAWRHLLRMESFLHPADRRPLWRAIVDFHRRTLPLTLLSLLGFGIIWLVWPALFRDAAHRIAAYLILLSALTVPHALTIGWLDGKARMKDEG